MSHSVKIRNADLGLKWNRLAPNGKHLKLLKTIFEPSQNILKIIFKILRFGAIWCKSELLWAQIKHSWWQSGQVYEQSVSWATTDLRELLASTVTLPPEMSSLVSFHQYMSGGGTPLAVQSNTTVAPMSTSALGMGSILNVGSAV